MIEALRAGFKIEKHEGLRVLRDDLLEGGTKTRFLPYLIEGEREAVFGAPFCGGAPPALAFVGREMRIAVTIFYAKRAELHRKQKQVLRYGGKIITVEPGYMTNVQAKARAYAGERGARFLPLGFDVADAELPFIEALNRLKRRIGSPGEIWVACGSGMLARCLSKAFPDSLINPVAVGLKSRHLRQSFGANVRLHEYPLDFAQECKSIPPFPSCPNYDAKAFEFAREKAAPGSLFWNVAY